jgi:hypothetical protein
MDNLRELIAQRRAELERQRLAALGPITDAMRVDALAALLQHADHDTEDAARAMRAAALLAIEWKPEVKAPEDDSLVQTRRELGQPPCRTCRRLRAMRSGPTRCRISVGCRITRRAQIPEPPPRERYHRNNDAVVSYARYLKRLRNRGPNDDGSGCMGG